MNALNVNLFICHTPLHVLISLLVSEQDAPQQESIFVVIEDSTGLHKLAQTLTQNLKCRLELLPGAANSPSLFKRTLTQRSNAKILRALFNEWVHTVFLFHDLRAESQALLNLPKRQKCHTRFVLLEDGIALYEPRGLLAGGYASILKRKIAFGMNWKHARELGLHPAISEIRSFYPHLLRTNLKHKQTSVLPTTLPSFVTKSMPWADPLADEPFVVIAVPHTFFAPENYLSEFISSALLYCEKSRALPIFKLHPRDDGGLTALRRFIETPHMIPQEWPLELLLLSQPNVHALIGSRTSALHITKALIPTAVCAYFDDPSTEEGKRWINFLEAISIPSLNRAPPAAPAMI